MRRAICVRWQEVVPDGTGSGSKLTYSCECAGEGCPFDPRREKADALRSITKETA